MVKNKRIIVFFCLLTCLVSYIGMQQQTMGTWKVKAASSSELKKPTISIKQRTATTVTVKMNKVVGANGYQIYRGTVNGGEFTKIATTSSLEYKDTERKPTSKYYYKVRAYKVKRGKRIYSSYSNVASVSATLKKTESVKVANQTFNRKVSWTKVTSASKYNVYRSDKKDGTYRYIGNSKTTSYTDRTADLSKKQYYRVRAYKKASGIKYYGVYSNKVEALAVQNGSNNNPSQGGSTETSSNQAFTKEVLRLVNVERAKVGLNPVTTTSALEKAAFIRAKEIKQTFAHTRPDGTSCFTVLKDLNISYQACGENIAYGQRTPEAVMNAWMNSPGHKANILSSNFGKLGVGCYIVNNTVYWTQLFTN